MSSQRYERVNAHEDDDTDDIPSPRSRIDATPSSPPPSFHSRSSSLSSRRLLRDSSHPSEADQTLADTFGEGDGSDEEDEPDDRQRLMRATVESAEQNHGIDSSSAPNSETPNAFPSSDVSRRPTTFSAPTGPSRVITSANDGVFANMAAKPERGEKNEDLPPSYEEAAADATPPYWETTIVAPGISSDEVYVDGLPVGSIFSFIWNAMISVSFQVVGFLLTYLLHTTHAAKHGSRAGLGLTLVQYGFYMKGGSKAPSGASDGAGSEEYVAPPDPNSHSFDPSAIGDGASAAASSASSGISTGEAVSYVLMIVGWFILIRAVSDFLRARRHEQLVLQSPDRGLPVPVIAEGESTEMVV